MLKNKVEYSCDFFSNGVINDSFGESEKAHSSKSVRISEETFYFGSNDSDNSTQNAIYGKDSEDSTYFSGFASEGNEDLNNGVYMILINCNIVIKIPYLSFHCKLCFAWYLHCLLILWQHFRCHGN